MMHPFTYATLALAAGFALGTASASAAEIALDFETDASGSFTVLDESNATSGDGTPDSVIDFTFDYIAAGIPLAPNSTGGDSLGLKMAANETANDAGAADHITAFHTSAMTATSYLLQVDIYMRVEAAGGTTEFSHVGVGSDGTDFNSIFTPIAGDGHFLAMTGDGGSSSDFRHFVEGTPVNSGDSTYLNSDNTTNATGDTYQAIFAGGDFPGSPGNRWTTLTIEVLPGFITYKLDGTPIIRTSNQDADGLVSLGYTDAFSSVGPHFVVYDNLLVTVPAPAHASLVGVAALAMIRRRRA